MAAAPSLTITKLFIYPVKSLPPVQVSSVELTNEGLRFDRSFVLVNPPKDDSRRAKFLTIKKLYKLALFKPTIVSLGDTRTVRQGDGADRGLFYDLG
jgi:uncharacterized protein YcbX